MIDEVLHLFNLKPEEVIESAVSHSNSTTFVDITLIRKTATCPYCGGAHVYAHGFILKKLKHPILYKRKCIVRYHARRYKCQYCGSTFFEENSFCKPNTTYTSITYERIFEELKDCSNTFKSVAKNVGLSTTHVINIFDSIGIAKRRPFSEVICIDEYHDPKTGVGTYNCVFMNWFTGEVIDVLSSRTKHYLQKYVQNIPKKELDKVKYVSIDMWLPYKQFAQLYFKNAKIVVDSFHVIKNLMAALKKVKLRVMRKFDIRSNEYYLLNHFNWLLEKNYEDIKYNEAKYNRKLRMSLNYHELLNMILKIDDELAKAYEIKESYHYFNKKSTYEEGREKLSKLINSIKLSGIKELQSIGNMLSNWSEEIVNSLIRINGRRISNGPIEGLNSRIKKLINGGCGYNNFERERNRIFFCINKKWVADPITEIRFIKRTFAKRGKYKKKKKV